MARRAVRSFAPRTKRQTDWALLFASTTVTAVPANSKVLMFATAVGSLLNITPSTLIRTRGQFGISTDQLAADEEQIGAVGIAVVPPGSTAATIPGPDFDATWDGWLYHRFFQHVFRVNSAIGAYPDLMHSMEIDSKAMRKLTSDQLVVLMVENAHATNGFNIAAGVRFLIKAG